MNDIIRAFYPEMAEFINQDPALAATDRTLFLDLDLNGVIVIKKDPTTWGQPLKQVEVAAFYGAIDSDNEEIIKFVIRYGRVDLQLSHNIVDFKPHSITWDKNRVNKFLGGPYEFRYNVFDNAGFDLVFEWAKQKASDWVKNKVHA